MKKSLVFSPERIIPVLLFWLVFPLFQSCTKEDRHCDTACEINEFIWKGMNTYYLWQANVPDLADDRFSNEQELKNYAQLYGQPDLFFESLIWQRDEVDKWSWIVDDYEALEAYFNGVRQTSGAKFKLYLTAENSEQVFGIIRYVLPGTDAADKPIERGDVFGSVNGVPLTVSNYKDLLINATTYTLDLGDYVYHPETQSVEIVPNGEHVSLTKGDYNENPVFLQTVFNTDAGKIGYLMYNSFTANYDNQLNDAFAYFQSEGISDLILDLRYNGGGSVRTAMYLSGMITGQYEGQVFSREIWNDKMNRWLEENHPDWAVNLFTNQMQDGTALNNLHLNRLYVITTGDSASASELVINALKPYIDVYVIGSVTHGKYAASVTLYDSPDFTKNNVNPDHKWAMQPIVLKEVNANGEYSPEGFSPDNAVKENPANMGVLGDENEPLLNAALDYIQNGTIKSVDNRLKTYTLQNSGNNLEKIMYISLDN